LEDAFAKFGSVVAIDVKRGFAFIQFSRRRRAC
jgi:hypothetical protein